MRRPPDLAPAAFIDDAMIDVIDGFMLRGATAENALRWAIAGRDYRRWREMVAWVASDLPAPVTP